MEKKEEEFTKKEKRKNLQFISSVCMLYVGDTWAKL